MTCYHPITAWQCADGQVVFVPNLARNDIVKELLLPCGQCIGCRLERARQWAVRCMHEASCHQQSAFITLTYSEAHRPPGGSLVYRDFQLFMMRLRKSIYPQRVRFYMCGEYGPSLDRPHYHACLFGHNFSDLVYLATTESGARLYRSADLERLWPFGFSSVGAVTFESAGYAARYCVDKITGDLAPAHYGDRVPEFNHMSLKPAIGEPWLRKYWRDVYPHDYLVVNGKKCRPTRYYDRWFDRLDRTEVGPRRCHGIGEIKAQRELDGRTYALDNTPGRCAVKEEVQRARLQFLRRNFDERFENVCSS